MTQDKNRIKRTQEKLSDPKTLEVITAHVANGGSLIDLCEMWDVRYSDFIAWIYADPERKKTYEQAIVAQGEWAVQRVLQEIRSLAFVDIRKLYDSNGQLKAPHEIPADVARAVAGIEVDELFEGSGKERSQVGWTKKVKFYDKVRALELLGKNLKLFTERMEHFGKVTLEDVISGSWEKSA